VAPSYKGLRYPAEIIAHCVWLYHRFPLGFREVEELMLARGVVVSHMRRSGSGARSLGPNMPVR
jgi:transposase-like protein